MELDRDTARQRDLVQALLTRGEGKSWRQYLIRLADHGYSHTDIAFYLQHVLGFRVDPRSIGNWLRQAKAETRKASGT